VARSARPNAASAKKPIEQYEHDETRQNNPPVGLVTPQTDRDAGKKRYTYDPHIDPALQFDPQGAEIEKFIDQGLAAESLDDAKSALAELKRRREPYLNWAGKAERTSFEVSTVSLHVHERIDPKTIMAAVRRRNGAGLHQLSLFETPEANPPLRDALDFYKHEQAWTNRLIAGDSLLVMNSLLEKEAMAGKVQTIYIDPPYGIRYGSNFQPFVNRRVVRDGRDEDLTQEPETILAFRDTWELGIHSYLTYLRDRLLLARDLLSEAGSIFVQIGKENLHLARNLMDEVFGAENSCGLIPFRKAGGTTADLLPSPVDFLLWYSRDRKQTKYHQLYTEKRGGDEGAGVYIRLLSPDGKTTRLMTPEERANPARVPPGWRIYRLDQLVSSHWWEEGSKPFEFQGRMYSPGNNCWKTNEAGLARLAAHGRIAVSGSILAYVRFLDDLPVYPIDTVWDDTGTGSFTEQKIYVVQTGNKVIARCLLMTTDPGDLVLDPSCGSGTTAYVAEQWGRRWITCDTSRVAIALAKQRLMVAAYDYYELAHPDEGVSSGFVYKTVPHVTLKSIANDEPPDREILYEQPRVDRTKVRVTGPFTVEAVPAPMVEPIAGQMDSPADDESVARSGPTLRHAEWRDELLKSGVRGKIGQVIRFSRVEPLAGTRWLQADAETIPEPAGAESPQRVVVSFGPEHAPLEQRRVEMAWEEARTLVPRPSIILFATFHFDPEAAKDIDQLTPEKTAITFLKAQMNTDLLTEDFKEEAVEQRVVLAGGPTRCGRAHDP
jgi:adenine-specific DNA-methyltransferase